MWERPDAGEKTYAGRPCETDAGGAGPWHGRHGYM